MDRKLKNGNNINEKNKEFISSPDWYRGTQWIIISFINGLLTKISTTHDGLPGN